MRRKLAWLVAAAAVFAALGLWQWLEMRAEHEVAAILARNDRLVSVRGQGPEVDLFSRRASFADAVVGLPGSLPLVVFECRRLAVGVSGDNTLSVEARGVRIMTPAALDDALAELGYDENERLFDLSGRASYDPKTNRVEISDMTLAAPALGRLRISLALGNVDLDTLRRAGPAVVAGFALIDSAQLGYEDHSLARRMVARAAAEAQADPAAYGRALARAVLSPLAGAVQPTTDAHTRATVRGLQEALAGFLADPRILRISLEPSTAVPVVEALLLPPLETLSRLNLSATARQGDES